MQVFSCSVGGNGFVTCVGRGSYGLDPLMSGVQEWVLPGQYVVSQYGSVTISFSGECNIAQVRFVVNPGSLRAWAWTSPQGLGLYQVSANSCGYYQVLGDFGEMRGSTMPLSFLPGQDNVINLSVKNLGYGVIPVPCTVDYTLTINICPANTNPTPLTQCSVNNIQGQIGYGCVCCTQSSQAPRQEVTSPSNTVIITTAVAAAIAAAILIGVETRPTPHPSERGSHRGLGR